ncbi:MAG TPA: hypothetical protein VKA46_39855 [Gemmataceae bacterium]|nr:hypothetical protein [Gemmataceae bacterium]
MEWLWLLLPVVLLAGIFLLFRWRRGSRRPVAELQKRFLQQREHLEAAFHAAAVASGKPRGLRWKNCEWESEVAFARERQTGRLAALVAVTISFEAIEGSDMEGVEAVGNLRNASAVFFYDGGRWRTTGKAIFNLNPGEAIEHFKGQYERLQVT